MPTTTDHVVVETILAVADSHELLIEYRYHKGSFRTVYLCTTGESDADERVTLRAAQAILNNSGIHGAIMTQVTNPDHPNYLRPMLEIDSVWWPE